MYTLSLLTGNEYYNGILIPQDDTNELFQQRCDFLENGGQFEIIESTPEEILEHNIFLIPKEISRMKFKMQIRRSTIYSYDIILEYLKNLAINETFTQDDKEELIDRLEDAVSFNRYHKDFINLANMLGVSDEIKDEIFIEGNKIE